MGAETMCSGREFQIWAAATGKARLPTVESLTGGTTSWLVPAERSARRPGISAVEVNGPRYCGASPWRILFVSTAILNWICSGTRRQCRLTSASWRDRNAWDGRWAVPQHSELTAVCAWGTLECRTACCSHNPAVGWWERPSASGMMIMADVWCLR